MDDIIRIIKSLENSGVLIDGVSESVIKKTKKQNKEIKRNKKNKKVDFLVCY